MTRWSNLESHLAAVEQFRRQMDHLFHELAGTEAPRHYRPTWLGSTWPATNIYDSGTALVVQAEVPGLSEKEIQISANQDGFSITGERVVDVPKGYAVHRRERESMKVSRTFACPCAVNLEQATAVVKDGVLTLTLPKAPEAQPRQIAVKAQ